MLLTVLLYILGGVFAGFISGLLGVGGGLVVVPFLVWTLPYAGIPGGMVMHIAVATSLALIVCTSIASSINHQKRKSIDWSLFWQLLPGMVVGAMVASSITQFVPNDVLEIGFGIFAIIMAVQLMFKPTPDKPDLLISSWPNTVVISFLAALMASICNLLGMGGGSLLVPFFRHHHMPMKMAVGTSALCGVPISLAGVIMLLLVSNAQSDSLPWTSGYIYWPAFLVMTLPSVLTTSLGARLAHYLPAQKLQRVFALFLLVVGLDMIVNVFIHYVNHSSL